MEIPRKTIKIDLRSQDPTKLTPENLQKQLNGIGLTCEHTNPKMLDRYIREVKRTLPRGKLQAYRILAPRRKGQEHEPEIVPGLIAVALGQWTPGLYGYERELQYVQFKKHFEWLVKSRPEFTGKMKDWPEHAERCDSVDAVKNMFKVTGTTASAAVVGGINEDAIEALLSNAIAPISDEQAKDYDESDSMVIFLVDQYDGKEAQAIGVLTLEWRLTIKDYKEKKDDLKHDTTLNIHTRNVLYTDINDLFDDFNAVKEHFGDQFMAVPA